MVMKNRSILTLAGCALLGGAIALVGCQSGNTSGGDIDNTGTQYDPNESGSMSLSLEDGDHLTTGAIGGFRVFVKDSNGDPVVNMPVTCDTESGLALVEPTTGVENTDSNGQISGKVGCNLPGSFLLACRTQTVSAKRKSATVICQGAVPNGFDGYPGGGGLGGGSADDDTISRVRITDVSVYDTGSQDTATTSIDITQSSCDDGSGTPTVEPFYDSSVKFTVVNDSRFVVRFTTMKYTVTNASSSGGTVSSGTISLTGPASVAVDGNGGSSTISSLLFDASGGGKRIYGSSSNISIAGFKNVKFTLNGENELGESFTITASTALSFDSFNRCSG